MSSEINVKVCVTEAWDTVEISVDAEATTIENLKREALNRTLMSDATIDEFEVKFRGALMLDESSTLAENGVPDGGSLIVMPISKKPVR